MQWQDKASGLPCLAVRNPLLGHWCGYVGVPHTHPYSGLDDQHPAISHLDAHGGITFTKGCAVDANEATGICHVPAAGENDRVWWFGFDCGHCFDVSPCLAATFPSLYLDGLSYQTYRTLHYVRAECRALATQLQTKGKQK